MLLATSQSQIHLLLTLSEAYLLIGGQMLVTVGA